MSPAGPDPLDRVVRWLRTDERLGRLCRLLLVASGLVIATMGLVAARAAAGTDTAAALRAPFAVAGCGLLLAGALTVLRVREALVTGVLAGLTGATFALSLAELSARAPGSPDRYDALWIPSALAAVLVVVRLLDRGSRGDPG